MGLIARGEKLCVHGYDGVHGRYWGAACVADLGTSLVVAVVGKGLAVSYRCRSIKLDPQLTLDLRRRCRSSELKLGGT